MNNNFSVIAHNIRSLYNIGSIFRTSDALGISHVYLTGYSGTPKNPKLQKTALGAEKSVSWSCHPRLLTLLKKLKSQGVQIVALENNVPQTLPLSRFTPQFPLALLLGEEVNGISGKYLPICNAIVEIPMQGAKESLNVATAFGIAAYTISEKITARSL